MELNLVRQARRSEKQQIDRIREMLIAAEESVKNQGFSHSTAEERLEKFKEEARKRGQL